MGSGDERDTLAPVIPLFGGPPPDRPEPARGDPGWADLEGGPPDHEIAPEDPATARVDTSWHPTWTTERAHSAVEADDTDGEPNVELAEKALLKKLRTRSLSVAEARGVLREYELDVESIERMLASMQEYGYLDDAALAEQVVHVGVDRKGQGRQFIAQALSKRGIPREIADVALAALPDDDLERALEFARGKARSMQGLDRDTALRRLSGQLARRGYGGSLAMTAARIALDEVAKPTSGVRFR